MSLKNKIQNIYYNVMNNNNDRFCQVETTNYTQYPYLMCCGKKLYSLSNKYFGICENCGKRHYFIDRNTLHPLQRKSLDLRDGNIGVMVQTVGTGKTHVNCLKIFDDLLSRDGWSVGVIGTTNIQLSETFKKELSKFFITKSEKSNLEPDLTKENADVWTFKNNSSVEWLTNDNINSFILKGRNLCAVIISEAESLRENIFQELLSRVRHPLIYKYKMKPDGTPYNEIGQFGTLTPVILKNYSYVMIEANTSYVPWIEKLIKKSKIIYYTPHVAITAYNIEKRKKDEKGIITYLGSTLDFSHQPDDYIKNIMINKSPSQIQRDLYCNIYADDGFIFTNINDCVVKPFDLRNKFQDKFWRIIYATDLGQRGATTMLVLAINLIEKNKVYVIDEYYDNNNTIEEHAKKMREMKKKYRSYNFLTIAHVCDKMGKNRELINNRSIIEEYANQQIYMTPPKTKSVKEQIFAIKDVVNERKIVFFNNVKYTLMEMRNMKYIKNQTTGLLELPKDNNEKFGVKTRHGVDSIGLGWAEINFKDWKENFIFQDYYYDLSLNGVKIILNNGRVINEEQLQQLEKNLQNYD